MNCSFFTCDRKTHLKIVVVALIAAFGVAVAGINARVSDTGGLSPGVKTSAMVVKAGKPAVYSIRDDSAVR